MCECVCLCAREKESSVCARFSPVGRDALRSCVAAVSVRSPPSHLITLSLKLSRSSHLLSSTPPSSPSYASTLPLKLALFLVCEKLTMESLSEFLQESFTFS